MSKPFDEFKEAFTGTTHALSDAVRGSSRVATTTSMVLATLSESVFGGTADSINALETLTPDSEEARPFRVLLGVLWAASKTAELGSRAVRFVTIEADAHVARLTGQPSVVEAVKTAGKGITAASLGVLDLLGIVATSALDAVTPRLPKSARPAVANLSGLIEATTHHPHVALELALGYRNEGITETSKAAVLSVVRPFLDDEDAGPSRTILLQIEALGSFRARSGTGDSLEVDGEELLARLFHGAHVVIEDGGRLYAEWIEILAAAGAKERCSSHYDDRLATKFVGLGTNTHPLATDDPQYGMDLPDPLVGHLLWGTCWTSKERESVATWVQLEGHGLSAREWAPHAADFLIHLGSGFSQAGPLGTIRHSEKTLTHIVVEKT